MQRAKLTQAVAIVVLAAASFAANAAVLFQNLGTSAPPTTIGGYSMTPFDQAAQAAIPNGSSVSFIPGSPIGGSLGVSPATGKRNIGNGWATWSHGYTGVVYSDYSSTSVTLTLPANTGAFYFYAEPNPFAVHTITATTNSGATSGAVAVNGASGANGYAFYTTAGESLTSITVSSSVNFAFGEFGISSGTTCASQGYTYTQLEWCKNICERNYTGNTLNMWIRRWIERYRQLPYCAAPPQPSLG